MKIKKKLYNRFPIRTIPIGTGESKPLNCKEWEFLPDSFQYITCPCGEYGDARNGRSNP